MPGEPGRARRRERIYVYAGGSEHPTEACPTDSPPSVIGALHGAHED
jgi:hypothetical protein